VRTRVAPKDSRDGVSRATGHDPTILLRRKKIPPSDATEMTKAPGTPGAFVKSAQPVKKSCLLAAVALQQIHWVYWYRVAADCVVAVEFHDASC
jgi:hypothetical protein